MDEMGGHVIATLFDAGSMTRSELRAYGRGRRKVVPRNNHARWIAPDQRADPLDILRSQDTARVPELVPIRYGRMLQSPFTFFRGSAAVMAADLTTTPVSGMNVQACGDAHVDNFGVYASPERRIVFDINDFDETLPGPWEWDLKRLAVSLVLDVRDAGWGDEVGVDAARRCVMRYQSVLDELAGQPTIAIEYEQMDTSRFLDLYGDKPSRKILKQVLAKATKRTHDQAIRKWVRVVDGSPRFIDDPPLIERLSAEETDSFHELVNRYRTTLQSNRRHVLKQYQFRDVARKVVGVGSVGMRSYIVLMQGRGPDDLLVLQAKEAVSSVLTPYWGQSGYERHGQRVVAGQRLMQAASDPFLGWAPFAEGDYYIRQLRDHKGPSDRFALATTYHVDAQLVGGTLARAHARSVDPAALRGYAGTTERFADTIATFAMAYANQVEKDFEQTTLEFQRRGLPIERGV
jgi:uncharacterized protein (DUF2252 family)